MTNTARNFIAELEAAIQQHLSQQYPDIDFPDLPIAPPPKPDQGDIGMACFPLAKALRKAPPQIAADIAENLTVPDFIESVSALGPFCNFSFKPSVFFSETLGAVLGQDSDFGNTHEGDGQTVLIEYSAPNTNKPQHLGHVRNNVLGMAVSNILEKIGNRVVRVNLVNDRGIHICKSMLAYRKWGEGKTPESTGTKGDHFVGDWYVAFEKAFQDKPELLDEAQEMLRQWEAGDEDVVGLWKQMNGWVYDGFDETYSRLGCEFQKVFHESETYSLGKTNVLDALEKGVGARNERGDVAIDLTDAGMDEKVLLRADGTSIYITQDIGTSILKHEEFHADRMIWVVASEQDYHFKVLFEVLKRYGYDWAERCHHLSYGMVYLPEGKMKSREGKVVDADALMDDLHAMAKEAVNDPARVERRAEEITDDRLENIAEMVSLGALKFYILKVHPRKDMHFNPKESLSFEGDTGPFLQYNHARVHGLLRQSTLAEDIVPDYAQLGNPEEKQLAVLLSNFGKALSDAARQYSPAVLNTYLLDLARTFSRFHHEHSVLSAGNDGLAMARLHLSRATAVVLKEGLRILGIEAPERM
jgi:arginyl-tRNA synthetase